MDIDLFGFVIVRKGDPPSVFTDAFDFCLVPASPRGSQGRVRIDIFPRETFDFGPILDLGPQKVAYDPGASFGHLRLVNEQRVVGTSDW